MNRLPYPTARHLSDEQLYLLLEDPSSAGASAQTHMSSCIACQSEFAALRASLANFRAAATGYAAGQAPVHAPALARRVAVSSSRSSWMPRPVWAASFASAVAVLGVSLALMHPHPVTRAAGTPTVVTSPAVPEESDEALLDGIQRDLSTSVPPSLEPLEVSAATGTGNLHN
jgi:anti-sigma factor RsiW